MDCAKYNNICVACKDNNEHIINMCKNYNDISIRDEKKPKDSTELSGGHLW